MFARYQVIEGDLVGRVGSLLSCFVRDLKSKGIIYKLVCGDGKCYFVRVIGRECISL